MTDMLVIPSMSAKIMCYTYLFSLTYTARCGRRVTQSFIINFTTAHPSLLCAVRCAGNVLGVWGGAGS
jgi:hypothetical protein